MHSRSIEVSRAARRTTLAAVAIALVVTLCSTSNAQFFQNTRSVGGVFVDPLGALDNASLDDLGKLSRFRIELLGQAPDDFKGASDLRKVSLRRLGEAIAAAIENDEPLPEEIMFLGGLQQIRYVFVYPEQQDIVLVGPAEVWKVDDRGNVVGAGNGRPVLLLDDLLVALRTAKDAANGGISCSIDPTEEGLARLRNHRFPRGIDPRRASAIAEKLLGPQQITFTGVPDTSHFARVLIAADYRMKRLGMGLDKSPVPGLPSYLAMIRGSGSGMSAMAPRWWLEPNYEPLLRSPDGLAWELRGASVKTMTEEELVAAGGNRTRTGRANPAAKKWAATMTEKFDELAIAEPVFGQLRNCMELAIVGALIVKENLAEQAGYSMPVLLDADDVEVAQLTAPKQVDSVASVYGRVMSVSGGVQLNSWVVADKVRPSTAPAAARTKAAPAKTAAWWWD